MKFMLSLGVMTMMMAGATAARAAGECTVTADCPRGFVCETYTIEPKPADGCTKDAPCGALEAAVTAGACVPATCATNADCGTDMVCHTQTTQACSGGSAGACAPDTKCAPLPPVEPVCTTRTTSTCTYRWQLPCNADSDCGGAFTCVAATKTNCPTRSGGGPTSSGGSADGSSGTTGAGGSGVSEGAGTPPSATTRPDGTTAPEGDVAECTTTTAFPGTCQPTATTCQADSECPSAWTCVDVSGSGNSTGTGTAPGGTATGAGGVGGGVSGSPVPTDQPTAVSSASPPIDPKITPELVAPQKVCLSPYGDYSRGGTPTSNGSTTGGASGPALPPTGEKGLAAEDSAQAQSSGCAVAAHNVKDSWPAATAGLALLGLVLASRRRTGR